MHFPCPATGRNGPGPKRISNVDHALVGPGVVFAIETETISMPSGRKAVVQYDGHRVLVDGHTPDRDPVAQAQANADYLRDLLKEMTARDIAVRPVVLFPGWWVSPLATPPRALVRTTAAAAAR